MIGHRGGVNVRSQEGSGRLPAPKYIFITSTQMLRDPFDDDDDDDHISIGK